LRCKADIKVTAIGAIWNWMAGVLSQHPVCPVRCWGRCAGAQFWAAKSCAVPKECPMTTTNSPVGRAAATPLTFAAQRGGTFPAVLTEDHAEVTAPAGGEPM